MQHAAIISDNVEYALKLRRQLEAEDICLHIVLDKRGWYPKVERFSPQVILVNISKSFQTCVSLSREVKKIVPNAKVVIISPRYIVYQYHRAVEMGVREYFSMDIALLDAANRVASLLNKTAQSDINTCHLKHNLQVDLAAQLVSHKGKTLKLRRREQEIFFVLAAHAGHVVSREKIVQATHFGHSRTNASITVHICKLRKRLKSQIGIDPVETIHGLGYVIRKAGSV